MFGRQDSPGNSNFAKTLRGIGTSGVNRVLKNSDPEKNVLTNLVIGRSVHKNSDTLWSAYLLTLFKLVFKWSDVSYLEVS